MFRVQSLIMQVAKRASVLKRKRSKSKMDTPGTTNNNRDCPQAQTLPPPPRRDSDGEVVFYIEEPKASTYAHTYYYYIIFVNTYTFAVPTHRFGRAITMFWMRVILNRNNCRKYAY